MSKAMQSASEAPKASQRNRRNEMCLHVETPSEMSFSNVKGGNARDPGKLTRKQAEEEHHPQEAHPHYSTEPTKQFIKRVNTAITGSVKR